MNVANKKLFISIAIIAICLAIFVVLIFFNKRESLPTAPSNNAESFSEIAFDIVSTIPGTDVSFAYPKNGFYGHGANVSLISSDASGMRGVFHFEPTELFDSAKGSEFVVMEINVSQNVDHVMIDDVVLSTKKSSVGTIEEDYVRSGSVVIIGGRVFFLYKVTEDVTMWRAIGVGKDEVVSVSLAYKGGDDLESDLAYKENDKLFQQILSHIQFE